MNNAPQLLTLEQAAALLHYPLHFVELLVERGAIVSTEGDTGRRVLYADLVAYQAMRRERERVGLREIVRISEELGLYDDEPSGDPAN